MGTRNLTMVFMDGEYKVAQYGQWDGYPEGNGEKILNFLKKQNIDVFRENLKLVSFLTEEEYKVIEKWEDGVWIITYPQLSRDVGTDILYMIMKLDDQELKLDNKIGFAGDGLFCEWGYIIDLDKMKLEVYSGFGKNELNENDRFYNMETSDNGYSQISLVKSYDINNLPEKEVFIKELQPEEEDE